MSLAGAASPALASKQVCLDSEMHVIVDDERATVGQYSCKGAATEPKVSVEDDWAQNPLESCRPISGG